MTGLAIKWDYENVLDKRFGVRTDDCKDTRRMLHAADCLIGLAEDAQACRGWND